MAKRVLLFVMASFYVLAGLNHFVQPEVYLPMMPLYLPWHRALIALSGAAEIALGLAVMIAPLRQAAAWGLIFMLIAIVPANIHIAFNNVPLFGRAEGFGAWNWVRLPFQAVLIAWAWWYTRD
jgi:uncharacterized membrane protein